MGNIREIVCKNFKRLVDSSGKTKREIAQQMGVSEATLQRWKSGASFPELPNIEKLASILGVDESEFYLSSESEVKLMPVSGAIKKALLIPDDIFELAQKLSVNDEAWGMVKIVLEVAIEKQQLNAVKKKKA